MKAIILAAALGLVAVPADATCWMPSHWGGLEEQLYNQCEAQERTNELLEEQQRNHEQEQNHQHECAMWRGYGPRSSSWLRVNANAVASRVRHPQSGDALRNSYCRACRKDGQSYVVGC